MVDLSFTLNTVEHFLLILVRISAFIGTAPLFGARNVPTRVKIAFAVVISAMLVNALDFGHIAYMTTFGYAILVMKEAIVGILIGFGANICTNIVLFAGNMIDTHLGLAMATEYDPEHGTQTTLNSTMYNYLIMLLLIVSNMHQYLIRAIIDCYQVIPIGGAVFDLDSIVASVIKFITQMFILAFRLTLPVFSVIMILNCVLGIMAKVAPQMNMFAVGIQLKVLIGFSVLLMSVMLLPRMAELVITEMKIMIVSMIEGMMP